MQTSSNSRIWRVTEAKARLSEVLRLAEQEGPQRIGTRKTFVVVPEDEWVAKQTTQKPLGQWLIENMPRGINLELPDRDEPDRENPFLEDDHR